ANRVLELRRSDRCFAADLLEARRRWELAAPQLRRMDSFGAGPAGLQHLVVRSRRLLPLGLPPLADRTCMGDRRSPRRMRSDVRQRLAMAVERLPSISRLFRRPLPRVLDPVVPNP